MTYISKTIEELVEELNAQNPNRNSRLPGNPVVLPGNPVVLPGIPIELPGIPIKLPGIRVKSPSNATSSNNTIEKINLRREIDSDDSRKHTKEQVLWIVQNDAQIYKEQVKQAVETLAAIDTRRRIVPLILKAGNQINPPRFGELTGISKDRYLAHLKINGLIEDISWNGVYAMYFMESSDPPPTETANILTYGLNPLGHGANWIATIYTNRIDYELIKLKDQGISISGSIGNWVKISIMHEMVHAVGGRHLFERTNPNFKRLLDENPISLMRPRGSLEWFNNNYKIETVTKSQFLRGFDLT